MTSVPGPVPSSRPTRLPSASTRVRRPAASIHSRARAIAAASEGEASGRVIRPGSSVKRRELVGAGQESAGRFHQATSSS